MERLIVSAAVAIMSIRFLAVEVDSLLAGGGSVFWTMSAIFIFAALIQKATDEAKAHTRSRKNKEATIEQMREFIVSKKHHMIKEYKTVTVDVVTPDFVFFKRGDRVEKVTIRHFYELTKI